MGWGFGEKQEELVAAVAAEEVVGAETGGDGLGDGAEGLVAGSVAVGVVDGLEVVDVDEKGREGAAVAVGAVEFAAETVSIPLRLRVPVRRSWRARYSTAWVISPAIMSWKKMPMAQMKMRFAMRAKAWSRCLA